MADFCSFLSILVIILSLFSVSYGNSEGDALNALKKSLSDPNNVLKSWDPTLVDPCTWFHITCENDHVTRMDLGRNNLGGHLVPDLGTLGNLQFLELYENKIEGNIPAELGGLKSLKSFDLFNNNLSGTIPSSLGKLSSLLFLRLNNNRLTGHIPKELVNIPNLVVLDLSNNDLCGTIPPGLERIRTVNLANNPRLGRPDASCP